MMKKSKPKRRTKINPIDHKIIKTMLEEGGPLTTREIARESEISWNTALIHLEKMRDKGWVRSIERGNRLYWVEAGKI